MRLLFTFYILINSLTLYADDTSLKDRCEKGYKSYSLIATSLGTCPIDRDSLTVEVKSKGSNFHSCLFNGVAHKTTYGYEVNVNNCMIKLVQNTYSFDVAFTEGCQSWCGARASFNEGVFFDDAAFKHSMFVSKDNSGIYREFYFLEADRYGKPSFMYFCGSGELYGVPIEKVKSGYTFNANEQHAPAKCELGKYNIEINNESMSVRINTPDGSLIKEILNKR